MIAGSVMPGYWPWVMNSSRWLIDAALIATRTSPAPGMGVSTSLTATLRSEEHTSELQSLMRISYAVFCLKKKTRQQDKRNHATRNRENDKNLQYVTLTITYKLT